MNGQAIAAQALNAAGLRQAASELEGPRPAGVREDSQTRLAVEARTARVTRP